MKIRIGRCVLAFTHWSYRTMLDGPKHLWELSLSIYPKTGLHRKRYSWSFPASNRWILNTVLFQASFEYGNRTGKDSLAVLPIIYRKRNEPHA